MKTFFIVCDQYNTMLIFANYLLGMNENQTSISKTHKQYTLRSIQHEKTKETIKEKDKIHTQKQELKNNDLTGIKRPVGY